MSSVLDILAVFAAGLGVGWVIASIAKEWRIDNLLDDIDTMDMTIDELTRQRNEDWSSEPWQQLQTMERKYARR